MHCLESTVSAGATAQKPNLTISLPGVVYDTTAGKGLNAAAMAQTVLVCVQELNTRYRVHF